jgi:multicomponent Na+:H+ antiporter subunit A
LLAAIIVIYHRTGSSLWTDPSVARSFTGGLFLLTLASLIAKSVQVPLHTWIPEAMAAPTPVSALLHAACYVTAGVYLAARLYSFGPLPVHWSAIVVWIGTITMLLGVMYTMVQTDLKRMLAFSTVSQIGYMITGVGIGTPLAIAAGLLHCLNHGFFKGGLFLCAGSVQHAAGTRDMNKLGGLAGKMPRTTWAWLIGAGSMMGIPLMSGFVSKWMLYTAALQAGWIVPALAAWVASLGTVFAFVKATDSVFLGSTTEATEHAHESPLSMQIGLGLLAAGSLVLGVAPQLAVNYFLNPVLAALGMGTGIQVTWFGITATAGSWFTTWGLVLALVSLIFGGLVYAMASSSRSSVVAVGGAALAGAGGSGVFTGGESLTGEGRLSAHDFSRIFSDNWSGFFRWSNVDRYYAGVWRGLLAISVAFGRGVSLLEKYAAASTVIFAAAFLAGVRLFAAPVTAGESAGIHRVPQLLTIACAVAGAALLLTALSSKAWRRFAPLMAASAAATVAGLAVSNSSLRLAFLELGAALAVVLVWSAAAGLSSKITYLAVIVISALSLIGSDLLMARGDATMARALLITSVFVKLAVVPLFVWLLKLADELPALVLGLIIAVLDIAAFGELCALAQVSPWMITPKTLWLGIAVVSTFASALLMLSQRDLKRLLVLSTVEDFGFLMLGVASADALGMSGALLGAVSHALAKALLFTCLSAPESEGALCAESTGLTARYPVSGFGFVFGMLAMLGVPPTIGFPGRWRLYDISLQVSPWMLAAFVISSCFALIAYALALTRVWWGPAPDGAKAGTEPVILKAMIVLLVILLLAGGLWPNVLQSVTWGVR